MPIKTQTFEVVKNAGLAIGKYQDDFALDDNFKEVIGVQVIELSSGGIPYYSIGIEDKRDVYKSIVHKQNYISGVSVPPNMRHLKIDFTIVSGDKIQVKTEIPAVLVTEIRYLIEFVLSKK